MTVSAKAMTETWPYMELLFISTYGMHCIKNMNRCIFYLVCESSCVVGDKMEMGLEQVQVAVMHILKNRHFISLGSTQSEGSFWVTLL